MNPEKYSRSITLLCPTCGSTNFETQGEPDETVAMTKCVSCGRETSKADFIRENSENISEHVKEMGAEIMKDGADELRKSLKEAFRGSKFIKIK